MGDLDSLSREFACEHSKRLWKQLVEDEDKSASLSSGGIEALLFAVAAAVAVQVARLAAQLPQGDPSVVVLGEAEPSWLWRNAGLFVLPFVAGYFARPRRLDTHRWVLSAVPFVIAALVVNLYPFTPGLGHRASRCAASARRTLVRDRLPVHGRHGPFARAANGFRPVHRRVGIYYVLIALGGGVLMLLTGLILEPIRADGFN